MKEFYFAPFEERRPAPPIPFSPARECLWQFLATMALAVGAWYLVWRWGWSLNKDALWFSIPVVGAETCAYIGLVLFVINLWATRDTPIQPPPRFKSDCIPDGADRPINIDVFFPTYDEEPELVRLSIRDAKRMTYPHEANVRIFVLDDGKRPAMENVAGEEGVGYFTREGNIGFKAGNLRNAMERTSGDFIVICDADTRPFPPLLENTLGYFRDFDVAWVQTPQWFFDLPEGERLTKCWRRILGWPGFASAWLIERVCGPLVVGADPFDNDPKMFYDVIQRRRNSVNASFCCGAGSIHRREAVMEAALKAYGVSIGREVEKFTKDVADESIRTDLSEAIRREVALETEFTPYKFHVSEDIYTSIILHGDKERNWKSVFHPQVESKMLSPQDLQTWVVQRFKYAGGTLDIALRDNPLFGSGMTLRQKAMYGATFWSYLGGVWNIIFLAAPMIYLFFGVAPVASYSLEFFKHILPFLILNELAMMVGTWGVSGFKGKANYLAFFPINLRALWTVLKGEKIKFPTTPKERQTGNFLNLVMPQIAVIVLTATGILYGAANWYVDRDVSKLSALIANGFWGLNNIVAMSCMARAALWKPAREERAGFAIPAKEEVGSS